MLTSFLRVVLPAMLACASGFPAAHADVYTWVDHSGQINVSNLPPPEDVRVTSVVREIPRAIAERYEAARDAAREAELDVLAERVFQLELEAEVASRAAARPQVAYVPVPVTVPVPVPVVIPVPAYVQDQVETAPQFGGGCDPAWLGCTGWLNPGFYPGNVIVVNTFQTRRGHPARGFQGRSARRPGYAARQPLFPAHNPVVPALRPVIATGGFGGR